MHEEWVLCDVPVRRYAETLFPSGLTRTHVKVYTFSALSLTEYGVPAYKQGALAAMLDIGKELRSSCKTFPVDVAWPILIVLRFADMMVLSKHRL